MAAAPLPPSPRGAACSSCGAPPLPLAPQPPRPPRRHALAAACRHTRSKGPLSRWGSAPAARRQRPARKGRCAGGVGWRWDGSDRGPPRSHMSSQQSAAEGSHTRDQPVPRRHGAGERAKATRALHGGGARARAGGAAAHHDSLRIPNLQQNALTTLHAGGAKLAQPGIGQAPAGQDGAGRGGRQGGA